MVFFEFQAFILKRITFLVAAALLCVWSPLFGQNSSPEVYSIHYDFIFSTPPHVLQLDVNTGDLRRVGPNLKVQNAVPPQMDPIRSNLVYQGIIEPQNGEANYFYHGVDLNSGERVNKALISLDHNPWLLKYNCKEDQFYSLKGHRDEKCYLVKVNPYTAAVEKVGNFEYDIWIQGITDAAIHLEEELFVFIGYTVSNNPPNIFDYWIFAFDLNTGKKVFQKSTTGLRVGGLQYNCFNEKIYAIKFDEKNFPTPYELVEVNPNSGNLSTIGVLPSSTFNNGYQSIIDPGGNRYIYLTIDANDFYKKQFHFVDLNSGETTNGPYTKTFQTGGFNNVLPCLAKAGFSYKNNCTGAITQFTGVDHAVHWTWDFGDPSSGERNIGHGKWPQHVYKSPGAYQVKLITRSCYQSDSIVKTIEVVPFAVFDLGEDTILCPGESVHITMPFIDTVTYTWPDSSHGLSFTLDTVGVYVFEANSPFCHLKDTIEMIGTPVDSLDLGSDYHLCPGDSDTIRLSAFETDFNWHNGSTDSIFVVDQPGTYSVTAFDGQCTKIDSIVVNLSDPVPEPVWFYDTTVCPNRVFTLVLDSQYTYSWWGIPGSHIKDFQSTSHVSVTAFNQHGCSRMDTFIIRHHDLSPISLLSQGDSLFVPQNKLSYEWKFNTVKIPKITGNKLPEYLSGDYSVEGLDENGCWSKAEIFLPEKDCDDLEISPNPTSGEISLEVHRKIIERVILFDAAGHQIKDFPNINLRKFTVDFPSEMISGLYLLNVITNQCSIQKPVVLAR